MTEEPKNRANMFSKSAKFPAGFMTEHGSVYAYVDNKASTQRFKVANGPGQGELHAPQTCVFIEPIEAKPRDNWHGYFPGYIYKDGDSRRFRNVDSPDQLPPNTQLVLFRPEREGKVRDILNATFTPTIGYTVLELANTERGAHKGHNVVEVIPVKETVLRRMETAGANFGRERDYFKPVADALKGQGMKRE